MRSTIKIENAAFSKSVICTSILLNSTRQPMGESTGGGLNLIVCQLVDWIFSKWSIDSSSFWSMVSENCTRGSRIKRWPI